MTASANACATVPELGLLLPCCLLSVLIVSVAQYVVSMKDRRLCAVPPPLLDDDGAVLQLQLETVAELSELTNGPCNDMVMDEASGLSWVGNFGWDLFGGKFTCQSAARL